MTARALAHRGAPGLAAVAEEPRWVRLALVGATGAFLGLFLVVPLVTVFVKAFEKGIGAYLDAVTDPMCLSAVRLTLVTAAIVVPINVVFGLAAAWAVSYFHFRGKNALITLIDVPFSVSPVVAGMLFVLVFGAQGLLGPWAREHGIKVIFALPGIVLATLFVTCPFVAREVIPTLQGRGRFEEEAALTLGAGGFRVFWHVTLPKIRWSLLYGTVLCAARAMGEFGAVSVVSGHIRGETNTLPLHVEVLYNEYQFTAAFAAASLLTAVALVVLLVKTVAELRKEGA
jgi:sulfate transport system permease protein